jgi:hypothetical protein
MQEQDIINQIKNHAAENIYLFEIKSAIILKDKTRNLYGVLYIDNDNERDNHCEQCKNEQVLWFGFRGNNGFPNTFSGAVSTEKYEKFKDNLKDLFGPNDIEIVEKVNI